MQHAGLGMLECLTAAEQRNKPCRWCLLPLMIWPELCGCNLMSTGLETYRQPCSCSAQSVQDKVVSL